MAYFVGLDVSVKETSVCIVDDALPLPQTYRSASIRSAPPHGLHLLGLAHLPPRESAMELGYLAGWSPADVLHWFLSNPNGPSPKEQEQTLLLELCTAKNAKQAAVALLSTIYSRQQAALQ